MLKLLLKKQLAEIFRNYFYDPKKNRARSKAGTAGYILLFLLLMVGLLGGMFAALALALCGPLAGAGLDWLYFAMMGLLAVVLGTFGSVFSTYSCLYLAKDNDLLLSLPIPVNVLIASRLLTVYLMGAMYSAVVILPAVVVYWVVAPVTVGAVLGSLLLMLLISVFVLTLSCALGWAVAKISLKLKHKSFFTVAASLAFLVGYYFICFQAQALIQDFLVHTADYAAKVQGAAYPLYLLGKAGTGDAAAMLAVTAAVLALFALVWALLCRSFLHLATSTGKAEKPVYKEKAARPHSIPQALLAKELQRFLASPVYMLNCGLGTLLLPVCGVLLLLKGGELIPVLDEVVGARPGCTPLLLCAALCVLASMNIMAAPSISLEGRTIWLVQSLPVTPWQVLRAKMTLQLLLTGVPLAFCAACLPFTRPYSAPELLATVFVLLAYGLFSALYALFLGVVTANLTWTNEMTPIKQNMGVLFAMFGGFAYSALLCAGFLLLGGWKLGFASYMALFGAATLALCALLWLWLRRKGCSRFAAL